MNAVTDPLNGSTTFQLSRTNPIENIVEISETPPSGDNSAVASIRLSQLTETRYDALGRAYQTMYNDGTITETKYNNLGHRVAEIAQHDPTDYPPVRSQQADSELGIAAITTNYEYDPMTGQLTAVILPPVKYPQDPQDSLQQESAEFVRPRY